MPVTRGPTLSTVSTAEPSGPHLPRSSRPRMYRMCCPPPRSSRPGRPVHRARVTVSDRAVARHRGYPPPRRLDARPADHRDPGGQCDALASRCDLSNAISDTTGPSSRTRRRWRRVERPSSRQRRRYARRAPGAGCRCAGGGCPGRWGRGRSWGRPSGRAPGRRASARGPALRLGAAREGSAMPSAATISWARPRMPTERCSAPAFTQRIRRLLPACTLILPVMGYAWPFRSQYLGLNSASEKAAGFALSAGSISRGPDRSDPGLGHEGRVLDDQDAVEAHGRCRAPPSVSRPVEEGAGGRPG